MPTEFIPLVIQVLQQHWLLIYFKYMWRLLYWRWVHGNKVDDVLPNIWLPLFLLSPSSTFSFSLPHTSSLLIYLKIPSLVSWPNTIKRPQAISIMVSKLLKIGSKIFYKLIASKITHSHHFNFLLHLSKSYAIISYLWSMHLIKVLI